MANEVPIICHGCGRTGSVGKVTASLICAACGHGDDLDIFDGTAKTAAPHGPGNGWTENRPNALEGWDEYQGPAPSANPLIGEHLDGTADAYSGHDYDRGNPDYSPGGGYEKTTWPVGPTTGVPPIEQWDEHRGPNSGGARWQGKGASIVPLHVTLPNGTVWEGEGRVVQAGRPSSNPLGTPEQYVSDAYADPKAPNYRPPTRPSHPSNGNMKLNAQCPNCGNSATSLVRDHKDDAWWACQKCGPLANIDANPDINPHSPPFGFTPDRSMKSKGKNAVKGDGQILKMVAAITENNSGLSTDEALELSRQAVLRYGKN